jgi:integrase
LGRTGAGVEVREKSIRFTFLPGKPTLTVQGTPAAPTPANVRWAHRLAGEIREKMRHGTFTMAEYFPDGGNVGEGLTVGKLLDNWLAARRIEHSTRSGYESAIKFWKAAPCDAKPRPLGDQQVRATKHSHILTAMAARADLSGKTVNNYLMVLRAALDMAVVDGVIEVNPAGPVPKAKHQKPQPDPFDQSEAEAIIASMREHYPEQICNLTEWWFFSGVRTGEMAGLRWSSVDLAKGRMVIHESIVRGREKAKTKTAVSRDVILNSRALSAIKRQKAHTFLAGAHVWLDPADGEPWMREDSYLRSYWVPTLKRLGIRYRRPYNMRHTYATMMLMAGMTPAFCARQLGHSVQVFLSTYAKWIDGGQDAREMERLEGAMLGKNSGKNLSAAG